jgi:hypothetical protein
MKKAQTFSEQYLNMGIFMERQGIRNNLQNIQLKLERASGLALSTELRMRLIGQLSDPVKNKLKDLYLKNKKEKKPKRSPSDQYWDCDLWFLELGIIETFRGKLTDQQIEEIKRFRDLRNKLLHGDFVGLMNELKVTPVGRQIFPKTGEKNILQPDDIKEAIISIDRTVGLSTFNEKAINVIGILDKIIHEWI